MNDFFSKSGRKNELFDGLVFKCEIMETKMQTTEQTMGPGPEKGRESFAPPVKPGVGVTLGSPSAAAPVMSAQAGTLVTPSAGGSLTGAYDGILEDVKGMTGKMEGLFGM